MSVSQTARPTLLFIPDISGFTEFVNDTDITHSQHIVEELLETLIDANELGMTVSEIEGDAVLFYREGPAPTAAELLAQVQRMYVRFHAYLKRYETHRICHCGACSTASGLALKIIAHYGEVSQNRIKDHSKLFGRDVIIVHRLMKNDVPEKEYVLLTHDLLDACTTWVDVEQAAWDRPHRSEGTYDFGSIKYCYISLGALMAHVPEPTIHDYSLSDNSVLVLSDEAVIEAPIDLVFDVVADLSARHLWQDGLSGSDRLNSKITQHGSTHRCVIKDSEKDPFIVSHDFKAGRDIITFTDTERRQGWSVVFTLRRIGAGTTRVENHLFVKNILVAFFFRLFLKKKLQRGRELSYQQLHKYCRNLVQQESRHPAQIVLETSHESNE